MSVILVGSFASTINNTMVGVALPSIADDFGSVRSAIAVDWVVTGFLLGVVSALPATGWLSDRFGRKALYVASLTAFCGGAAMCMAAPNIELLVLGRFVQGVGSGAITPVGLAIVYDLFPPNRRGYALGVWGVATMAGPAVGPPFGGWVVSAASWRWSFGVFVIVSALAVGLSWRWLPDVGHQDTRALDVVGWILATVGVIVVLVGLRRIGDLGATSLSAVGALVAGAAALIGFVHRSLRRATPLIEFRMFAVPTFAAAMVVMATLFICQFAYLTFLPVELQVVRGMDPRHVGLLLTPAAIGTAAMMPVAGWLVDRTGARIPVVLGLSLFAVSMWELGHLTSSGSDASIVRILVVQGAGFGLAFVPSQVSALNSLPGRFVAQASAVSNLVRQLGGAVGVAALSAVLVADLGAIAPVAPVIEQAQASYNRVFLVGFGFAVAGTLVAFLLPGRNAALRHRVARTEELSVDPPMS